MSLTVKEARELAGMSQVAVAHELGVSEPTYRKYERHPDLMSLRKAVALARILQVEFTDLRLYEESGVPS